MGWKSADNKLKDKEYNFYISFTEFWEIDLIKEIILEEMPCINDSELSKALIECYNEMSPPRRRSEFLKNLRRKLEL